jgi:RNA polymerase sigma-32 factor
MSAALMQSLPSPVGNLDAYLFAVHQQPLLSADEERQLAERYREHQDLQAAWTLVASHLRFVAGIARRYSGYGLSQEDLIQEGNVGLMKAVKRFDPDLGVRLVTYAVHWIKAEIHEFIIRNWRIVKVATTKAQRKLFFNLRSSKKRLAWMNREEVDMLADSLNVGSDDVAEMEMRLYARDSSFDGPLEVEPEVPKVPSAYLEDNNFNPEVYLSEVEWQSMAHERLHAALDTLDARSRDIVERRWLAEEKSTLQELAVEYGVSAERIRQIEDRSIKRLRDAVAQ